MIKNLSLGENCKFWFTSLNDLGFSIGSKAFYLQINNILHYLNIFVRTAFDKRFVEYQNLPTRSKLAS
jgi:hypothetical protein